MFDRILFSKIFAAGCLSLALAVGCGSSGGAGSGTGDPLGDSVLGSAEAAAIESSLISLVSEGDMTPDTISGGPAAEEYAAALGDCATVDLNVVTIEFPCDDYPNVESGTLEVTFGESTVAFETIDPLVTVNGAEITISSTAVYQGESTWLIESNTEVSFGEGSSTTEGDYTVTTGDPCSTINGDVTITMDLPELEDLPVDPMFNAEFDEYEVCNDGGCPDGTYSIGLEGIYEIAIDFDKTTGEATITIDVTGQDSRTVGPVVLECTTR